MSSRRKCRFRFIYTLKLRMDNSVSSQIVWFCRNLSFFEAIRKYLTIFSLEFQRGKITAYYGAQRYWQTTLLKLIGGQLYPEQGSVTVDVKMSISTPNRAGTICVNAGMFVSKVALINGHDVMIMLLSRYGNTRIFLNP